MLWPAAGALAGTGAGWCVAWIVTVARHGADLPMAALTWGTGATALFLAGGFATGFLAAARSFCICARSAAPACGWITA